MTDRNHPELVKLDTTKGRLEAALLVRDMRTKKQTWADVKKATGVAETTGRKLLAELEEYEKVKAPAGSPSARGGVMDRARQVLSDEANKSGPKPKQPRASTGTKVRSGRYLKLECGCGTVIRAGKKVAEMASVQCKACGKAFAAQT